MSWSYDAKGRITGKTQVFTASTPNVSLTVGYGYNAAGQPTTLTLPSGRVIQYTFNANGQVASVVLVGSPNTTILNNITYDPFGPITGWTWGNATIASRTFDADGKITQVTSAGQRTFGYDDAFRINAATVVGDASNSWALGYDILDRLNSATKPTVTIGYTYDANGNRLTQTGTSASTYTVSGTSNKLSSTTGVLARTYSYDAVGNTQNSGATAHAYNNRGRMKTARLTSTSTNTNYDYDALGQRYRKGGGTPGTIYFMYDEAGHLLGEYNSTGALIQETVWLGDIPVATIRPKTGGVDVFYVHSDQLNTPRKVTRPNDNALRWRWDPTPFGEGAPDENPASLGQFKYHLRFPGQYFDMETNLNYNYFRDYDPAVARYVQSDRIGLRGGINTYGYGFANPLRFADPRGLVPGAGPGVAPPAWHPPRPIPGPIRALGRAGSRALWWLSAVVTAYEIYEMCKEEDQECDAILEEEINSCYEQYEDLGSGADWMRNACIARAKERWGACNRNGGTMPPGAPPPWGDQDVDGWGR
jgi:RHS repeat-associated protein